MQRKRSFFYVKGNAYLALADKKIEADKNLSLASAAYLNLIDAEKCFW